LVELEETLYGEFSSGSIIQLEVMGSVRVKALLPGDNPKVQVKLALPEDYDEF
jgi:hypothetical protein